jgi:hypothetical protein
MEIGLPILFIWMVVFAVCVAAYLVWRWWRRRHPIAPKPPEPSYARRLVTRLSNSRSGRAAQAGKRR